MSTMQHDALASTFNGSLVSPGDAAYDEVRAVHNGLVDKRPGLIARCHNVADVQEAVNFGRDGGLEVSVRGGGHNVAGRAVTEGGLMIDLSLMRGVDVDPRRQRRAQGGATWNEYNRTTHVYGQATTGGVVSTTGVGGLTLGGGLGWLMGTHGLAIDNVTGIEVVTADGQVRIVDADNEPDLFWALRGGGGNFGVAASIEFETHPLDTILGGLIAHPLAAAGEVIDLYRQVTKDVSDDATIFCGLVHAPDGSGTKLCGLPLCHAGEPGGAEAELRPLRDFGPPILDLVQPMPYPAVNTMLDDAFPRGALNYWKSAFLTELSDAAVRTMIDAFEAAPSIMSGIVIEHFHGEVCRIDPTATAYPHREPGYNLVLAGQWLDPAETDTNVAWVRDTALLRPPGFPDFQTRTRFVDRGVHEIVGRAWSGHAPIVRVEVSADGGTTWDDATLSPEADRYAWRPWHWAWAADATGPHTLCARATDAAGNTQPVEQRWNRQAMANNHVQRVTVVVR